MVNSSFSYLNGTWSTKGIPITTILGWIHATAMKKTIANYLSWTRLMRETIAFIKRSLCASKMKI